MFPEPVSKRTRLSSHRALCNTSMSSWKTYEKLHVITNVNNKHLKNVGPIRHCEPPHVALPFTRCRYCCVARRLCIDVHDDDDDNAWQRGPLWLHRIGPIIHTLVVLGCGTLYIAKAAYSHWTFPPTICWPVAVQCTMAKRLIGYGCGMGC